MHEVLSAVLLPARDGKRTSVLALLVFKWVMLQFRAFWGDTYDFKFIKKNLKKYFYFKKGTKNYL